MIDVIDARKNDSDPSDAELLNRVISGDLDAYEGIMRRHNQRLFRLARSIVTDDAEAIDVVQEAYICAYQQLGELKNRHAFGKWIGRITRNAALMRLRKSRRYQFMDESEIEDVLNGNAASDQENRPERELANLQLKEVLESCIDELPDAFRAVFMLRAVEMCSVETTAEILDLKQATVKTRFHRARTILQKKLIAHGDAAGVAVHEFAGHRCDQVVANVMRVVRDLGSPKTNPEL